MRESMAPFYLPPMSKHEPNGSSNQHEPGEGEAEEQGIARHTQLSASSVHEDLIHVKGAATRFLSRQGIGIDLCVGTENSFHR